MQRVRLEHDPDEYGGLVRLSVREMRPIADQARYIVRRELEAAGLIRAVALPQGCEPSLFEARS